MRQPTVSVLMPIRNGMPYLLSSLASLYAQSVSDWEWILVDDGSTDETPRVLRTWGRRDPRVVVLETAGIGVTAALNRGLEACRGTWVARMDADDLCHRDRFRCQLGFLSEHPGVVAVGAGTLSIDDDSDPIGPSRWRGSHAEIVSQLLNGHGGLSHPAAMIRRDAIEAIGGYADDLMFAQDKDLWLRLADIGSLANLSRILLYYREHAQSVSQQHQRRQRHDLRRAVNRARSRRGMTPWSPANPNDETTPRSEHAVRWAWIRRAFRAGNRATARKQLDRLPTARTRGDALKRLAMRCRLGRRPRNRDVVPRFEEMAGDGDRTLSLGGPQAMRPLTPSDSVS